MVTQVPLPISLSMVHAASGALETLFARTKRQDRQNQGVRLLLQSDRNTLIRFHRLTRLGLTVHPEIAAMLKARAVILCQAFAACSFFPHSFSTSGNSAM